MELQEFRYWLAFSAETILVIPIFLGIRCWKNLNIGQKNFVYFLATSLVISVLANFVNKEFKISNRFFSFFYSLGECIFLFRAFALFFNGKLKSRINAIAIFSMLLLVFDLIFISKFANVENTFSGTIIRVFILAISVYYLFDLLSSDVRKGFNELNLFIALSTTITYFFKSCFTFISYFLLETRTNYYLYYQVENFVNFFIIVATLITSWAFYKFSRHQTVDNR